VTHGMVCTAACSCIVGGGKIPWYFLQAKMKTQRLLWMGPKCCHGTTAYISRAQFPLDFVHQYRPLNPIKAPRTLYLKNLRNLRMPSHAPKTPSKARTAVPVTPVSLLAYLDDFEPEVPDVDPSVTPGPNTRSSSGDYEYKDIPKSVPTWEEFNLDTLQRQYEEMLKTPVMEPMTEVSPQKSEFSTQSLNPSWMESLT
jgi:hypothetical protein